MTINADRVVFTIIVAIIIYSIGYDVYRTWINPPYEKIEKDHIRSLFFDEIIAGDRKIGEKHGVSRDDMHSFLLTSSAGEAEKERVISLVYDEIIQLRKEHSIGYYGDRCVGVFSTACAEGEELHDHLEFWYELYFRDFYFYR